MPARSSLLSSISFGDFLYDAFYSGAIGGAVIALFFLVIDALQGQPLFTPSLMGGVLFSDLTAATITEVRLDWVAFYSIVHLLAFGALGALLSFLFHEVEMHSRNPVELLILFVFVLVAGSFIVGALWLPGVIERLGASRIAVGNLLAGGAMVFFLLRSHRREPEEGTAGPTPSSR